jgi:hypothetical protein
VSEQPTFLVIETRVSGFVMMLTVMIKTAFFFWFKFINQLIYCFLYGGPGKVDRDGWD